MKIHDLELRHEQPKQVSRAHPITAGRPQEIVWTVMTHPTLSAQQREWFDAACARIDEDRIRTLNFAVTGIHSPTGLERSANEFMIATLKDAGLEAKYQPIDEDSGNAIGWITGSGGGPTLLLYSPIDTHLDAVPERDIPWVGAELRSDMVPEPHTRDGLVIGLGAANPKAMVTTLTEAARVVKEADIPLKGDLVVAFAGGGMPVNATERRHRGMGDGVYHLITRGVTADFAIVMKGTNAVYYEEPGMCWFKVSIKGTLGYAGMPHDLPNFRSSIVPAAKFILEMEKWLPAYTSSNTSDQVAPQGWVSAVRAGWPDKPAFTSATTEVYFDIRCSPAATPAAVKAQFAEAVVDILARHPDMDLEWELCAAYPGARTDPDNWIIQSAIRAWEEVEGKRHEIPRRMSGQTDISTIRNLGIPTARTGWTLHPPHAPQEFDEGLGGMGVADIRDAMQTCRKIVYSVIDTCTRTRLELGL